MNLNFMKLREQMENQKVSYYLVPSEDPHQSEYVDDYFKCRQYISGFTGSAGTFLAGCEEGWLWTDGRYFTQAEGRKVPQLIDLHRMLSHKDRSTEELFALRSLQVQMRQSTILHFFP